MTSDACNVPSAFAQKERNAHIDPFLCSVNPYIRLAWYCTLKPFSAVHERVIYDYEIVLITAGQAVITIDGARFDAGPGDLFFFKPGQRHSMSVGSLPLIQPHVHFDLCYDAASSAQVPISFKPYERMTPDEKALIRPEALERFYPSFPNHLHFANTLFVEQLLFDVISSYNAPSPFPEIRLKWHFLRLLDHLLTEIGWRTAGHSLLKADRARLIRQYLDHHTHKQVTLDELSSLYHIDKSYISRVFREMYHVTPISYHLTQRIEKAKLMMMYTNFSLTLIADQTGFGSLQDFSRAFRRQTGLTPSEYRKAAPSMLGRQESSPAVAAEGGEPL